MNWLNVLTESMYRAVRARCRVKVALRDYFILALFCACVDWYAVSTDVGPNLV